MLRGVSGRRVFMTADSVGGVWRYAIDLSGGLSRRGWQVTLALLGPEADAAQRAEAASVPNLELVATGLPLDWTASRADEVRASAHAVARLARGAEIVHLNSAALAVADFEAPLLVACHSCVATWWRAVRGGPLPAAFEWQRALTAEAYCRAGRLVAPSAAFADATEAVYGVRPSVVFNGRTIATASAAEPAVFVFTAGRLWDDGKNIRVLDAAAASIDAPIVAAGPLEGPNGAAISLPSLRTPGRIDSDAVAGHLAQRPVFAAPARYEPFGLAVLEAAQAGCALVLSDIPTFRELWGDAAEYVAADQPTHWAATLQRLLRDPDERSARGQAARARAARYTVDAMVEGTEALYCSLLATRQAAA